MARQFNGADSVGTNTKGNASQDDFTGFALFKPDGNAGGFIMHNGHGNDSGAGWGMGVSGTTHQFTADIAFVAAYNTGLFSRLKRWNRGVILRRGGTWHAFLNGKKSTVVITNAPFTISDRYYIGARSNSSGTLGSFFRGGIKRVSLWARAVSDQEGMALSKGTIQPHQIPLSLSQDHILNGAGTTEPAFRVGLTLTVVGATITGNASAIYRFFADIWQKAKRGGTSYTTELTETVTLVDTVTKLTGKVLTDVVTLVDTVVRAMQRTLTETVTLVDSVIKATARTFTEIVRIIDGWGSALDFNGTTTVVNIGSPSPLATMLNNFSFECRVKLDSVTGFRRFFAARRTTTANGWGFGLDGAKLLFTTFGVQDYVTTLVTLITGREYHLGVVFTSSNHARFYVNGVFIEQINASAGGMVANTDDTWQLGAGTGVLSATLQELLDGPMDEARLYQNRALSDAEMAEHAANRFVDETGLVFYYDFEEATGTSLVDKSGNGYHGTITSGSWVASGVPKSITYASGLFLQTTKVLGETVTLVDTVIKSLGRTLTDAITLVDSIIKSTARTLTDPVVLVDTITRSFNRTLSEVVTLVDTLVRQTSRTLTEAITVVDTLIKATAKVLNEAVTLSDTILRAMERTFTETVTLVDTVLKQLSKTFTEAVTLTDTFAYRLITKMRKGATILLTAADKAVTLLKKAGRSIL